MVTDKNGTLDQIDPSTNTVWQEVLIAAGSYNPLFSEGIVWITGVESSVLTAVDAATGKVLASVAVGPKPRFLTAGGVLPGPLIKAEPSAELREKQKSDRHDSSRHTRCGWRHLL
jgi:hypothetical protein